MLLVLAGHDGDDMFLQEMRIITRSFSFPIGIRHAAVRRDGSQSSGALPFSVESSPKDTKMLRFYSSDCDVGLQWTCPSLHRSRYTSVLLSHPRPLARHPPAFCLTIKSQQHRAVIFVKHRLHIWATVYESEFESI
jgi:hypothetical protein